MKHIAHLFPVVCMILGCNADPLEIPKSPEALLNVEQKCEASEPTEAPRPVTSPMPESDVKEVDQIAKAAGVTVIDRLLVKLLLEEGHQSAPAVKRLVELLNAKSSACDKK